VKTVQVWRIDKTIYAKTVKLGEGARLYGGRWNSPGRPAIYCGGAFSLCLVEILAHIESEEDAGVERGPFRIELPADSIFEVPVTRLPKNWRRPLNTTGCRKIGDAWLKKGKAIAMKVPSAIVPMEFNTILNPLHPDFTKVSWSRPKRFKLEPRLLQNI